MKLPCPVCGREVRLTLDCRLYSHCPPGGGHPRCSGSGEGYRVMVAPIPECGAERGLRLREIIVKRGRLVESVRGGYLARGSWVRGQGYARRFFLATPAERGSASAEFP
jgi:hypothetical protein